MQSAPARPSETGQCEQADEFEEILKITRRGVDKETQRLVEKVLKFVPIQPQPEIDVFTSRRVQEMPARKEIQQAIGPTSSLSQDSVRRGYLSDSGQ